ncbi:MAG: glycosyl hydrolase-related protein [Anaerolineales bacterium]|nr:glycosyl hydrolase-related protein [Anaerolineales bacterium]
MQLTAVMAAEDSRGLIVRAVNLPGDTVTATLTRHVPIQHASLARLDETTLGDLAVRDGHTIGAVAAPHQVLTFRLGYDTT